MSGMQKQKFFPYGFRRIFCGLLLLQAWAIPCGGAIAATDTSEVESPMSIPGSSSSVERWDAAITLSEWARDNADPVTMLASARALLAAGTPFGDLSDPWSPTSLLAEAKKLARGNQVILGMIEETAQSTARGRVDGEGTELRNLAAGESTAFKYVYASGEVADAMLRLLPESRPAKLQIIVRDETNKIVYSWGRTGSGNIFSSNLLRWKPEWCGQFTIEVLNKGPTLAKFALKTAPAVNRFCKRRPADGGPSAQGPK